MPGCARDVCSRWRPDLLARRGVTGLAFDGAWFCSAACLERAMRERFEGAGTGGARRRRRDAPRIGALLASFGLLRAGDIAMTVEAQKLSGRRFGDEARRLGLVTELDVLRALAAQEGVSYLATLDNVPLAVAPGGLSGETVRALGVVPFAGDAKTHRLHVACAAPVPRLALAAIAYLTGWSVEPFLVTDEWLPRLIAAYADGPGKGRTQSAFYGVDAAAARITRAATDGRADRLAHARCDRHVWIRLEGCAGPEDLLLPIGSAPEDVCQAAHTSH